VPDRPLELSFQDDQIASYILMNKSSKGCFPISWWWQFSSLVLVCLDVQAYTAQQRTKEFGIRKVLGASVLNITN
jgi:hypothetical protein